MKIPFSKYHIKPRIYIHIGEKEILGECILESIYDNKLCCGFFKYVKRIRNDVYKEIGKSFNASVLFIENKYFAVDTTYIMTTYPPRFEQKLIKRYNDVVHPKPKKVFEQKFKEGDQVRVVESPTEIDFRWAKFDNVRQNRLGRIGKISNVSNLYGHIDECEDFNCGFSQKYSPFMYDVEFDDGHRICFIEEWLEKI